MNGPAVHLADHCVALDEEHQDFSDKKERRMANKNLTIKLTDDQRKQIREATGKDISELNIELASTGHLSENNLDQAARGIFIHEK